MPIPSLTVLLPCYIPNEQDIVEETIEHLLTKLRYTRSFTLVVCYNTPHPLPIEEKLAAMEGQRWQGACGGLNTLRVLNVRDSTTTKSVTKHFHCGARAARQHQDPLLP